MNNGENYRMAFDMLGDSWLLDPNAVTATMVCNECYANYDEAEPHRPGCSYDDGEGVA